MNATKRLTPKQRLIQVINRIWFWLGLPELMRPQARRYGFSERYRGIGPTPRDLGTDVTWFTATDRPEMIIRG